MMLEKGRECIASMIQRIEGAGKGGEELSAILMSCFNGLAIQKIIDPAFDPLTSTALIRRSRSSFGLFWSKA